MIKIIRSNELKFVPASHEDPINPGVYKKILFSRADLSAGRVQMINWALLPRGSEFQNHYHEDMDEVFIIVSGSAELVAAGTTHTVGGGDAFIVPMKTAHRMRAIGDEVQYLVIGITLDQGGKTVIL